MTSDQIWGRRVIVSGFVPRDEKAVAIYQRSLLLRLLSGRTTDVQTVEGEAMAFELPDGTLVISRETAAALAGPPPLPAPQGGTEGETP